MINLHPKSRGSVTLTSSDPFEHPTIDPAYLENEDDIDVSCWEKGGAYGPWRGTSGAAAVQKARALAREEELLLLLMMLMMMMMVMVVVCCSRPPLP